jgi:hypothetical protein
MIIFVNASNIHTGGGKVILNDFISATKYLKLPSLRQYGYYLHLQKLSCTNILAILQVQLYFIMV